MALPLPRLRMSVIRELLSSQAAGGQILMLAAAAAMGIANSSLAEDYFHLLHVDVGPMSLLHWINDALMAVFFLLVGCEIKREFVDGEMATWPRRILRTGDWSPNVRSSLCARRISTTRGAAPKRHRRGEHCNGGWISWNRK